MSFFSRSQTADTCEGKNNLCLRELGRRERGEQNLRVAVRVVANEMVLAGLSRDVDGGGNLVLRKVNRSTRD